MAEKDFDEYIKTGRHDTKVMQLMLRKTSLMGGLDKFMEVALQTYGGKTKDYKKKYKLMLMTTLEQYNCYKECSVKKTESKSFKNMVELVKGMYELDEKCGVSDEKDTLKRLDSHKEEERKLKLLDNEEKKFWELLKIRIKSIDNEIYKKWLLEFAKLIYIFNGYQPYSTNDVRKALLDAYVHSPEDHFEDKLKIHELK
jgi:hypothetical protein